MSIAGLGWNPRPRVKLPRPVVVVVQGDGCIGFLKTLGGYCRGGNAMELGFDSSAFGSLLE